MKRRIYIICQKEGWTKGRPQVLSDRFGKLEYVFASQEGLSKGKQKVKRLLKRISSMGTSLYRVVERGRLKINTKQVLMVKDCKQYREKKIYEYFRM